MKATRRLAPLAACAAIVLIALASFAGVLARPGLVGHTWDWGVPSFAEQFASMARHHFSTWDAYFETGRYHYFKLELLYWQLITPLSVIGGEWMSKLLPLAFVTASGLAMLPLARFLGLSWFYATLAAVFYAFSPYTYSRVVAGHMPMLAGFALIPLLLWAFFRLVRHIRQGGQAGESGQGEASGQVGVSGQAVEVRTSGKIRMKLVIVCGLLLGLTSMHPSVGVGSALMLGALGLYFLALGPGRLRVVWAVCMIFGLALFMNIHFMAPFLGDYLGKGAIRHGWGLSASAKGEVTVDTELPMREGFHRSTSQPVDAAVRLDLRPGMDTEYAFPAPKGMRALWVGSSLVLAGLALCSFLARRGRAETGGLFLLAVVGVILVSGSRTPIGHAFYQWLLKGAVPILFAAFSNTTRWLPIVVTAYALLAFQLPQAWEERGLSRPWRLRAALALTLLIFISPYLGQKLLDDSPKDTVPQPLALKHTPIHPEDARVYSFLRDQRAEFRVVYLPPVGISWPGDSPYGYEWSSAYSPKGFFLAFYNNPLGERIIRSLYAEQPSPHLDRLFGLASVKYLVYPRYDFFLSYQDFQPNLVSPPVVDGFKNYKPVLDRTLSLQRGFTRLEGFDTVDILRNPWAAPTVHAAPSLLAVADASGRGGNVTAAALPDIVGLDLYAKGQAVVPAGDDPRFLALLERVMGGSPRRAFLSGQAQGQDAGAGAAGGPALQAFLYRGKDYALPAVEFRRLRPTAVVVRLSGVTEGFPLVFNETYHEGWKLSLLPIYHKDREPGPDPSTLLDQYRVFPGNEADQLTPEEVRQAVRDGRVSTLGPGEAKPWDRISALGPGESAPWEVFGSGQEGPKRREALRYGPGGRVVGREVQEYRVGFISKPFVTTVQNDNLKDDAHLGHTVRFEAPGAANPDFDPLSPASWSLSVEGGNNPVFWPEMLHWQAQGYANAWWIEPALLSGQGGEKARYIRDNPRGGVDMELLIEFAPQRYYLLGLLISTLTVALALTVLAGLSLRDLLRRRRP